MNASTDPLVQRFLTLCCVRLRQAIAQLQIDSQADGLIAILIAAPAQSSVLSQFMPEIVAFLCQLGNFKRLAIQTDHRFLSFEMTDLLATFPTAGHSPLAHDRSHLLEVQAMHYRQNFEALANYAARTHHVFLISTDGRYLEARLQRGSPGTVTPEQMIGQPLSDFIGVDGAAYLMQQLLVAYADGSECPIVYSVVHPNGEARLYQGTLIPVRDSETCILLSRRVTQPVSRSHSPAVRP